MISKLGRFALLLGLVAALGAWGAGGLPVYALTATVEQVPGQPPYACLEARIMERPPGCKGSGPLITGLDTAAFPAVVRHPDGTLEWLLRMVGSWDGETLNLVEPPTTAPQNYVPVICTVNPGLYGPNYPSVETESDLTLQAALHVLASQPCNGSIAFEVWVADSYTVTALIDHYPGAAVVGLMQPVGRS